MDRGRRCGGRALGIAIAAALVMMGGGAGALSNDGDGSWQYYKDITISNPGGALSDSTIPVSISGARFFQSLNTCFPLSDARFPVLAQED